MRAVYAISFVGSERMYVGSTVNLDRRIAVHIFHLRRGTHHSIQLQRAFAKYGEQSLDIAVIERVDDGDLLAVEQVWLDALRGRLYNASATATNSRLGKSMSGAAKQKISLALAGNAYRSGIPHDAEARSRIGDGLRAAYAEGRRSRVSRPENLSKYNNLVSSGAVLAKHRKVFCDNLVVDIFRVIKNYEAVGREFGITGAGVKAIVKRVEPKLIIERWNK